jgi:hypothetical protein
MNIGHKRYPITDYVKCLPLSVTLTLEVGRQVLRIAHRLIKVTICGKCYQNPLIYKKIMDRTKYIPYVRLC